MPASSSLSVPIADIARGWLRGTTAKIFFVLMLALLPMALGAIVASWQSLHTAEQEKVELMTATARQNARYLAVAIETVDTVQSLAAATLASADDREAACNRFRRVLDAMAGPHRTETVVADADGRIYCGSSGAAALLRGTAVVKFSRTGLALTRDGLLIRSQARNGRIAAYTLYTRGGLMPLVGNEDKGARRSVAIRLGDRRLDLSNAETKNPGGIAVAVADVGTTGLQLLLTLRGAGGEARALSLVMPLLLWLGAAFLGWIVVRWALIQPLVALRREVATYAPGKVVHPPSHAAFASTEIVELGEAFHEMSKEVAEHEGEMQAALMRQMKLTREVHHRVKNNLQIISSLISLHWRAAGNNEISGCYMGIQRRVDALAVVQRNHYAELDEGKGVRARPMIHEIASGLKTSAQIQTGVEMEVATDCDDVYLHQDIAAPIAFMTAELADLAIALGPEASLTISLVQLPDDPGRARFAVSSPAFRRIAADDADKVDLFERVLNGLARQLRTPLEHDFEAGRYHLLVPVLSGSGPVRR